MGDERWYDAIVLMVFGRVSIGVGKIHIFELAGVVEEHRWSEMALISPSESSCIICNFLVCPVYQIFYINEIPENIF